MEKRRVIMQKLILTAISALMLLFGCVAQAVIVLDNTLLDAEYYRDVLEGADISGLREHLLQEAARDLNDHLLWDRSMVYRALLQAVEEKWVIDNAYNFMGEVLFAFEGGMGDLHLELNPEAQEEIFKRELKREIREYSPETLRRLDATDEDLEAFISEVTFFPRKLTLVSMKDAAGEKDRFKKALGRMNAARLFLLTAPYISLLVLAGLATRVIGFIKMLKWLGFSIMASGACFFVWWRSLGKAMIDSVLIRLEYQEGYQWLVQIWPYLEPSVHHHTRAQILQVVLVFAGIGTSMVIAWLVYTPLFKVWTSEYYAEKKSIQGFMSAEK